MEIIPLKFINVFYALLMLIIFCATMTVILMVRYKSKNHAIMGIILCVCGLGLILVIGFYIPGSIKEKVKTNYNIDISNKIANEMVANDKDMTEFVPVGENNVYAYRIVNGHLDIYKKNVDKYEIVMPYN